MSDIERERDIAVMEGEMNAAEDGYFDARPQIDTGHCRHLFRAGFERAWKARAKSDGGAVPVATVKTWNAGGSGEFTTAEGIEKLPDGTKLYTAPQKPAQGEWVKCSERLPTEADVSEASYPYNQVWVEDSEGDIYTVHWAKAFEYLQWMPTGLKRPVPPAGSE